MSDNGLKGLESLPKIPSTSTTNTVVQNNPSLQDKPLKGLESLPKIPSTSATKTVEQNKPSLPDKPLKGLESLPKIPSTSATKAVEQNDPSLPDKPLKGLESLPKIPSTSTTKTFEQNKPSSPNKQLKGLESLPEIPNSPKDATEKILESGSTIKSAENLPDISSTAEKDHERRTSSDIPLKGSENISKDVKNTEASTESLPEIHATTAPPKKADNVQDNLSTAAKSDKKNGSKLKGLESLPKIPPTSKKMQKLKGLESLPKILEYPHFSSVTESLERSFPPVEQAKGNFEQWEIQKMKQESNIFKNATNPYIHFFYRQQINRFEIYFLDTQIKNVELSSKLCFITGYNDGRPLYNQSIGKFPPEISGGVNQLLVYCNICDKMIFGNKMINLLRAIPVNSKHGEVVERIYDTPMFNKVNVRTVNEIEFEIRNMQGQFCSFYHGPVIAVLVFTKNP
uniref:Uncharacterized protein n=1 Tax=Panagrolaimus sp. JU765 TaxID=591449 RepID=A0AC34RRJ3_9BILA